MATLAEFRVDLRSDRSRVAGDEVLTAPDRPDHDVATARLVTAKVTTANGGVNVTEAETTTHEPGRLVCAHRQQIPLVRMFSSVPWMLSNTSRVVPIHCWCPVQLAV